jgi:hypothetical protein
MALFSMLVETPTFSAINAALIDTEVLFQEAILVAEGT